MDVKLESTTEQKAPQYREAVEVTKDLTAVSAFQNEGWASEKDEAHRQGAKVQLFREKESFYSRMVRDSLEENLKFRLERAEGRAKQVDAGLAEIRAYGEKGRLVRKLPVAKKDGKWASAEEKELEKRKKEFSGSDLCTVRELKDLQGYFQQRKYSGFKPDVDKSDDEKRREFTGFIDSILSVNTTLSVFNDDYLSNHIAELFDCARKLKDIPRLQKQFPAYYASLASEKKAALEERLEYSEAFLQALHAHVRLHGITFDEGGQPIMRKDVAKPGQKKDKGHIDKVHAKDQANYNSALEELKKMMRGEGVIRTATEFTTDTKYSSDKTLKEIEDKSGANPEMYSTFREEYRAAYGEIKRAASIRDDLRAKQKTLLARYNSLPEGQEKEGLKLSIRVNNEKMNMANSHIGYYREFVDFLNGDAATISERTEQFLRLEESTGITKGIASVLDLLRLVERNKGEDAGELREWVKNARIVEKEKGTEKKDKDKGKDKDKEEKKPKKEVKTPKKDKDDTAEGGEEPKKAEKPKEEEEQKKEEEEEKPKEEEEEVEEQPKEEEGDKAEIYTKEKMEERLKTLAAVLQEQKLEMPKVPNLENLQILRSSFQIPKKVKKGDKEETDYFYRKGTAKPLMESLDWLIRYHRYQADLKEGKAAPLKKLPIPLDGNVKVKYDGYETQEGLNCWCCAGVAIFRQFMEKKGIKLSEEKLNQFLFRAYVPKTKSLKEIHDAGQTWVDETVLNEYIQEGRKFMGGTAIGSIYEAADYFYTFAEEFGVDFRLNRMTFSVPGPKEQKKARRDFKEGELENGKELVVSIHEETSDRIFDVKVRIEDHEKGKARIIEIPKDMGTISSLKAEILHPDKSAPYLSITYNEDKSQEKKAEDEIIHNNQTAAFLTQVKEILSQGNLVAVLRGMHYVTINGIKGREISFLNSSGKAAEETQDVGEFINSTLALGDRVELTWFSPLDPPEALTGEFGNLSFDKETGEYSAPLEYESVQNVFQTKGVSVGKTTKEMGEGKERIGYSVYIPKKIRGVKEPDADKTGGKPKIHEEEPKIQGDEPKIQEEEPKKQTEKRTEKPKPQATTEKPKPQATTEKDRKDGGKPAAFVRTELEKAAKGKKAVKLSPEDIVSQGRQYYEAITEIQKKNLTVRHMRVNMTEGMVQRSAELYGRLLSDADKQLSYTQRQSKQQDAVVKRGEYADYRVTRELKAVAQGARTEYGKIRKKSLSVETNVTGNEFLMSDEFRKNPGKEAKEAFATAIRDVMIFRDKTEAQISEISGQKVVNLTDRVYSDQLKELLAAVNDALETWFTACGTRVRKKNPTDKDVEDANKPVSDKSMKNAIKHLPLALEKYRFYVTNMDRLFGERLRAEVEKKDGKGKVQAQTAQENKDRIALMDLIGTHPEAYRKNKREIDSAFAFYSQLSLKEEEDASGLRSFIEKSKSLAGKAVKAKMLEGVMDILTEQSVLQSSILTYQMESAVAYIKFLLTGERTDSMHASFVEKRWKAKIGPQ